MPTYSFLDTSATLVGPGVLANLGAGASTAEEGISIEREVKNTKTIGADGHGMNSLHANSSGTVTVRLLKTSPQNQILSAAYAAQASSSVLWGNNVLVIANPVLGDDITCTGVSFQKHPSIVYAVDGGMNEWVFDALHITGVLG